MRVCPKPLGEQTIWELVDCSYSQSTWFIGRVFQSYLNVFSAPGDAVLIDWSLVLFTFGGATIAIAKTLSRKAT